MALYLPPEFATRRLTTQKYIYLAKRQLAGALQSGSPVRIRQAKLTLIRHMMELVESPELGPTGSFCYGRELTVLIQHFRLGDLDWDTCVQLSPSYRGTAVYIQSTVRYEPSEAGEPSGSNAATNGSPASHSALSPLQPAHEFDCWEQALPV
jgi:hypothetical protein